MVLIPNGTRTVWYQPCSAASRSHNPSRTPHGDAGAASRTAQLPDPSHDSGPATSQQPQQEGPHAARGAQGCGTVPGTARETLARPTMTTQATPSGLDEETADFPTLAAMQAPSAVTVQHQQSRTGGAEQGTDEAMTDNPELGGRSASYHTPQPGAPTDKPHHSDIHTRQDNKASGGAPSAATLAANNREAMPTTPLPPAAQAATVLGPRWPGGATKGIQCLSWHAHARPGVRPSGALQRHPAQPAYCCDPPAAWSDQHLRATNQGASHPRAAHPRRPRRRVNLLFQPPAAKPGANMGPTPCLHTHAH